MLTCEAEVRQAPGEQAAGADPTERAILDAAADNGTRARGVLEGGDGRTDQPFDPDRKLSSVVVRGAGDRLTSYAMGAPENMIPRLEPGAAEHAERLAATAARVGVDRMRVLLVARRDGPRRRRPRGCWCRSA